MTVGQETDDIIDPVEAKKQLRRAGKDIRSQIVKSSGAEIGQSLAKHGLDFCRPFPGSVISGFAPFGEELDTIPLMTRLIEDGATMSLPVMVAKAQPLIFREWKPGDEMKEAMWGIMEPRDEAPLAVPDVLLVPLLAFDTRGYRIGYGGGFYDRTIAGLRAAKNIITVGIAVDEMQVEAVPHDGYDEKVDWVLTQSGPIRCDG